MSNKMRFLYLLVCMLATVSLALSGCEVDEDADADSTGSTDTGTTDTTDTDPTDTAVEPLQYRFMRIKDLSNDSATSDPGADIDAVVVTKASGETMHANRVESYTPVNIDDIDALVPEAATGAPDAFNAYPTVSTCQLNAGGVPTYVSLGGLGGELVLEFPSPGIESNDTVNVLEVGSCDFDGGTARPEDVSVEVNVGTDGSASWVSLGTSNAPTTNLIVGSLPEVFPNP